MIRSNRTLHRHKYPIPIKRPTTAIVDFETVETFEDIPPVFAFTRPLSDNETKFLADGQSADDFLVFDCATILYAADDKLGVKGDIIFNHKGFDWRIVGAKYWGQTTTRHNWYKIQKISIGGETV